NARGSVRDRARQSASGGAPSIIQTVPEGRVRVSTQTGTGPEPRFERVVPAADMPRRSVPVPCDGTRWKALVQTCAGDRFERRILEQDRLLERTQRPARFEAELADERRSRVVVGRESVGLPPGSVEGEDQQLPKPLAQRMLADERLDLGGDLGVPS